MAVIYLEHPKHGQKVACSNEEAKADEGKGWKRFQVAALLKAAPAPAAPAVAAPVNALAVENMDGLRRRWEAKFGKRPHHKKSADTLRKELEA